jgi:type VI secretion system protein ImpF
MLSFLDRLIDVKSNENHMSIKRDLENLLNTRVSFLSWNSEWTALNKSLVSYGSPIFTYNICEKIRDLILRNDPRFKDVTVTLLNKIKDKNHILYLRIEGLLYAEPVPEPIIFDSIIGG